MRQGLLLAALLATLTACPATQATTPDPEPTEKKTADVTTPPEDKKELPPCGADDENCRVTRLGEASLGWWNGKQTAQEIVAKLGEPDKKGARMTEEASGDIVEYWTWSAKGVTLGMTAPNMTDPVNASRDITVRAPFAEKTERGIGIGSTEAEVQKAYAGLLDPNSKPGEQWIAGSIYGGVFFTITDGVVSDIFIGAGAE